MRSSKGQRTWPLVAAVLVLAALLRLPGFFGKTVWFDEALSLYPAEQGIRGAIELSFYDGTPGLFSTLLAAWMHVFGSGVTAAAALPFLGSLLGVLAMYWAGKELFDARTGLLAAALTAVAPLHLKFATEIRTYSIIFALAALSVAAMRRFAGKPTFRNCVVWTGLALLGMYAHYTFAFLLAVEAAYLVWSALSRKSGIKPVGLSFAALAAGYLPQMLLFERWGDFSAGGTASSYFSRTFTHGNVQTFFGYFTTLLVGERGFYPGSEAAKVLSVAAGAAIFLVGARIVRRRLGEPGIRSLAALTVGGIIVSMAANFIYAPRYFLIFCAPALLLLARLLSPLSGRRAAAAAAVGIIAITPFIIDGYSVNPANAFAYYAKPFAQEIMRDERPGDLVLTDHATDLLFRRYYSGRSEAALFFPKHGTNVIDMRQRFNAFDYDLIDEGDYGTLARIAAGRDRIWTIDYAPQRTSVQDPKGLKRRWLDANYDLARVTAFPPVGPGQKTLLLLYERKK